jgi:hypothetical protein
MDRCRRAISVDIRSQADLKDKCFDYSANYFTCHRENATGRTSYGNIARFVNHACNPKVVPCFLSCLIFIHHHIIIIILIILLTIGQHDQPTKPQERNSTKGILQGRVFHRAWLTGINYDLPKTID